MGLAKAEREAGLLAPLQIAEIDVFGDVAIMTCYNHFSYKDNGGREQRVARNTLVFLKTDDGWKIVHEHVTPKQCFED